MKQFSYSIMILLLVSWSTDGYSQRRRGNNTPQFLYGYLGTTAAGAVIGAEYERFSKKSHGWGISFRHFPYAAGTLGGMQLGIFLRPHFRKGAWDLHVTPGFGIFNHTLQTNNDFISSTSGTLVGPMLNQGILYSYSKSFTVGFNHEHYYNWFGSPGGTIMSVGTVSMRFRI